MQSRARILLSLGRGRNQLFRTQQMSARTWRMRHPAHTERSLTLGKGQRYRDYPPASKRSVGPFQTKHRFQDPPGRFHVRVRGQGSSVGTGARRLRSARCLGCLRVIGPVITQGDFIDMRRLPIGWPACQPGKAKHAKTALNFRSLDVSLAVACFGMCAWRSCGVVACHLPCWV